jgi:DNA-binding transcriptional LysR family regulator
MNIKQLEVFVAIAATGSFSKAAEAACITQSTVSQHIATLEDSCGVKLFDRTRRGVITTEAGKVLLVHARRALKSLHETEQAILHFSRAEGVELAVGGSTIPGTYMLPKAIAALRENTPGITVKVAIGDSNEILAQLLAEQIEIGIVGTTTDNKLFSCEALGRDEILLVARKGHHWCRQSGITAEELLQEPMIVRGKGSGTNDVVAAALGKLGVKTGELRVSAILSCSEAVKQAILAGCGVAFISEMAVRQELQQGGLVAIKIPGITMTRNFSLVSRKGRTLSPAGAAFCNMLRQLKE